MIFLQVSRILLAFFALSGLAWADAMEDAARALGRKIAGHLMANEAARISWREPVPAVVKTAFASAIPRRPRTAQPIDVRAQVSQNLRGPLLVGEVVREAGNIVEIVPVEVGQKPEQKFVLKLAPVWQQESPILDAAFLNGKLLVLGADALAVYERKENDWQRTENIGTLTVNVRDLRGHIEIPGDSVKVHLPGHICEGAQCVEGGILKAERNTLNAAEWPEHYSRAELNGEHLLAETDGHIHVYDSKHQQMGMFDGWESDLAAVSSACSGGFALAAESGSDSVSVNRLVEHQPVRVSDVIPLAGPVTAMWSQGTGATVIIKNKRTGNHEAFSASVDCGN